MGLGLACASRLTSTPSLPAMRSCPRSPRGAMEQSPFSAARTADFASDRERLNGIRIHIGEPSGAANTYPTLPQQVHTWRNEPCQPPP